MARTDKTAVAAEKFRALLEEKGYKMLPAPGAPNPENLTPDSPFVYYKQAGFLRVNGPSAHQRIYPAATKTVARVDISGFECADKVKGVMKLDELEQPTKSVKEGIDFEGRLSEDSSLPSEEAILTTFGNLLDYMMYELEPVEKAKREPAKKGAKKGEAAGWGNDVTVHSVSREDRKALIAKKAAELKAKQEAAPAAAPAAAEEPAEEGTDEELTPAAEEALQTLGEATEEQRAE